MTLWQFTKSYLSPVMLFFRICWLGLGSFIGLLAYSGTTELPTIALWAAASFLIWIALRPWGTTNIDEIGKKVDSLNSKYR